VEPSYGFDHSTLRLAGPDAERSARLDVLIAEQSCEVCKKMITDAQRRAGRRCFSHRLPPPPEEKVKKVKPPEARRQKTCVCGYVSRSKPNSAGVWICPRCRRTNTEKASP
jgi:hypothetical protein